MKKDSGGFDQEKPIIVKENIDLLCNHFQWE